MIFTGTVLIVISAILISRYTKSIRVAEISGVLLSVVFFGYFWQEAMFFLIIPLLLLFFVDLKSISQSTKLLLFVYFFSVFLWYAQTKYSLFISNKGDSIALIGASYLLIRLVHYFRNGEQIESIVSRINYIFFAPSIPIGPIQSVDDYKSSRLPLLKLKNSMSIWGRISYGIVKIYIFSSFIAAYALDFDNIDFVSLPYLKIFISLCLYSIYLYWNFSGAIDIVIGVSRLIGWGLPENFDKPFFATNIQEFWRNWHMSLTKSLRDLVFIPFVKKYQYPRGSIKYYAISVIGIFIVFLASALWHNFTLNYLLWGAWHAFFMSITLILGIWFSFKNLPSFFEKISRPFRIIITFSIVSMGWLFFIYPSPYIFHKVINYHNFSTTEIVLDAPYSNTVLVKYPAIVGGNVDVYFGRKNEVKSYQKDRDGKYDFVHMHGNGKDRSLANGLYEVKLVFKDRKGNEMYTYKDQVNVENEKK